jgi:hypothetical protein
MDKNVEIVRKALLAVFKEYGTTAAMIEESTYTGKDDPGEWAPRAKVVIHCESGIPDPSWIDPWCEVGDILAEQDLFYEPINMAVVAVYEI